MDRLLLLSLIDAENNLRLLLLLLAALFFEIDI